MIDFDFLLSGNEKFDIDKSEEIDFEICETAGTDMEFEADAPPTANVKVVDYVEKDNSSAVSSGAVYTHVEVTVGNIGALLDTI
jgi:hypothetical protein